MRLAREVLVAKTLARRAGKLLLAMQRKGDLQTRYKPGAAPVTAADVAASELLCKGLRQEFSVDGILSEESNTEGSDQPESWWRAERTWLIDPLDGTKGFIAGSRDFGVHIGLVEGAEPVLGVNYYPATDVLYFAVRGGGAYKEAANKPAVRLSCASAAKQPLRPNLCIRTI
jgi:3'(2'), 5'-bisphosphate nucleotidase